MQDRILIVKEERRYLLKRLLMYPPEAEILNQQEREHHSPSPNDSSINRKIKRRSYADSESHINFLCHFDIKYSISVNIIIYVI